MNSISKFIVISTMLLWGQLSYAVADVPESFAGLVDHSISAVVNVTTSQKSSGSNRLHLKELPDNPFDLFEFFQQEMNPDKPKKEYAFGSGFIIDPKGYIVTNFHLINGADYVEVGLAGEYGKRYKARVIGKDKKTDLALLKIDAKQDLPYLKLGNPDNYKVGDWIITIGNPYGLGGTVTKGIISAKARRLDNGQFDDYIQTDAPINRGNSGGPMIAIDGKVIGVNTAIISPYGGSIGIGFAIPSSIVKHIVAQLREFGHVKRSWLGVIIQPVTDKLAKGVGLKTAGGAMVVGVTPNSPGAKAGLKVGDIITQVGEEKINSSHRLPLIIADTPEGTKVKMKIFRDKKFSILDVKLEAAPKETNESATSGGKGDSLNYKHESAFGLTVRDLDPLLRKKYGIDQDKNGVMVSKVDEQVNSAYVIMMPGDVVMRVNQDTIKNLDDFKAAVEKVKKSGDSSVVLFVSTKSHNHFVVLDLKENEG